MFYNVRSLIELLHCLQYIPLLNMILDHLYQGWVDDESGATARCLGCFRGQQNRMVPPVFT